MKKALKFRKATFEDANEILNIQKLAYLGQAKIYQNSQIPPLTQTLKSLKEDLKQKDFLLALIDSQIVAHVRFSSTESKTLLIERIAVKPEFQNEGIGTQLLKEVEKSSENVKAFELFTGNKSLRNIHVYKKLGYRVVETKDNTQGISVYYMRKEL